MQYRHEWKHLINPSDLIALRRRLGAVARKDGHTVNGAYMIRSLYFDTPTDRALREKIDGAPRREKFRIRYYNNDLSFIRLEKKSKTNGLGQKSNAPLSPQEVSAIIDGDIEWLLNCDRPLLRELYFKMKNGFLTPKTIVDYTREPFIYSPGNVRVTADYAIRTGVRSLAFLDRDCPTVPVPGDPIVLEVKWDAYLPEIIRAAIQLRGRRTASFSKYAACRVFG